MVSTEVFEPSVNVAISCSVDKLFVDSVFEPSVDVTILCSVGKLCGDSVVIFKDPGKLSFDVILSEVDKPFVNDVVTFCSRDKEELSTVAVNISLDVAELSGMIVTLCNGVDFSVDVNLSISEFSFDVVGNSTSVVSAVRVVVAISGALIL